MCVCGVGVRGREEGDGRVTGGREEGEKGQGCAQLRGDQLGGLGSAGRLINPTHVKSDRKGSVTAWLS